MSLHETRQGVINALRELITCYDACQTSSPLAQECLMWRERFLDAHSDKDLDMFSKAMFMLLSDQLIKDGPEEFLKRCIKDSKSYE